MSVESSQSDQQEASKSWVVLTPDGPKMATPTTREQLATLVARRLRPDIISVNPNPSEREIKRILGQFTSEQHGMITKDMQDKIADKLRRPQEE